MRTIGSPLRSAAHRLEQWGSESLPANLAGGPDLTCARMGRVAPGWPHHPDCPVDTGGSRWTADTQSAAPPLPRGDLPTVKQTATDPETKQRALRRAAEVGSAQAARELGVPASSIRVWRVRAGQSGPPAGVDPQSWADRKEQAAHTTHQAAIEALQLLSWRSGSAGPTIADAGAASGSLRSHFRWVRPWLGCPRDECHR
jgi:transposase-like protein